MNSCTQNKESNKKSLINHSSDNQEISQSIQFEKNLQPIPIRYDFENLQLYLNSKLNEGPDKDFWRWDYMNSDHGGPDTIGVDHYMNINQPIFTFNEETTLPSLFCITKANKIIEFNATTIFHVDKDSSEELESLFDQLKAYELLNNEGVRKELLKQGFYEYNDERIEEILTLKFKEDQYDYDRITYSILLTEYKKEL